MENIPLQRKKKMKLKKKNFIPMLCRYTRNENMQNIQPGVTENVKHCKRKTII